MGSCRPQPNSISSSSLENAFISSTHLRFHHFPWQERLIIQLLLGGSNTLASKYQKEKAETRFINISSLGAMPPCMPVNETMVIALSSSSTSIVFLPLLVSTAIWRIQSPLSLLPNSAIPSLFEWATHTSTFSYVRTKKEKKVYKCIWERRKLTRRELEIENGERRRLNFTSRLISSFLYDTSHPLVGYWEKCRRWNRSIVLAFASVSVLSDMSPRNVRIAERRWIENKQKDQRGKQ